MSAPDVKSIKSFGSLLWTPSLDELEFECRGTPDFDFKKWKTERDQNALLFHHDVERLVPSLTLLGYPYFIQCNVSYNGLMLFANRKNIDNEPEPEVNLCDYPAPDIHLSHFDAD